METITVCGLTDTHAHLSYLDERGIPAVPLLDKLFAEGFGFILDIGTSAADLAHRAALVSPYPAIRLAAGVWPHKHEITRARENADALEAAIAAAPPGLVAAIGECGFDRRENPGEPAAETELLEAQLALADKLDLPVIIHSREAAARTIETLRRFPSVRAVIHCFSYTRAEAAALLDLGCYISFAGNLTFKNAAPLRDALAFIPAGRLLLETDCPFLAPVPYRGEVCHPGMLGGVYALAAELRGIAPAALAAQVAANARQLFRLDDRLGDRLGEAPPPPAAP